MSSWYVAASLDQLLAEIDAAAPGRSKVSDGSIGDPAHSSRESDHNPCDCHDAVCARDFTHDPAGGFDSYEFAEWLRQRCAGGTEDRVKYLISNGRIASETYGFVWNPYTGSNPHDHHVHVSVDHPSGTFDDDRSWGWSGAAGSEDDVPEYVSLSGPGLTVRAGAEWAPVTMTSEASDPGDVHGGTYAWLNLAGARYVGQVRLNECERTPGSPTDTTLLVRWAEYDHDTGAFASAPGPAEHPLTTGETGVHDEVVDTCSNGHRVRVELKARGGDVTVGSAGLTVVYWR